MARPEYYPTDPTLQRWAHEEGPRLVGDQKVKVTRPRLRHMMQGEGLTEALCTATPPEPFSEGLPEKRLIGLSAQKYTNTVINAGEAIGASPHRYPPSSWN